MSGNKYRKKNNSESKLEEFPEELDDILFFNECVKQQDRKLKILRSIVYKNINEAIIDKVSSYDDDFKLEDIFTVNIPNTNFTNFQWSVIREELLWRGIDSKSVLGEDGKLKSLDVIIERKSSLTQTLDEHLAERKQYL